MPLINHCCGGGGGGATPQLCEQVDNFTVTAGLLTATLTWTAPTTDEDSSFVGTRIVRKVGSTPQSKSDGTVVYEGTALTYTDTGLTDGTTYYYRAFAYNAKNKYQTAMRVVSLTAKNVSAVLNDNSWESIRAISDTGQAANYWSVGDCKEVVLNGTVKDLTLSNYSVYAVIIGFNHNAELEGTNRIHFCIGKTALTDGKDICLYGNNYGKSNGIGYFFMNEGGTNGNGTNAGGWASSWMRTGFLGTSLTNYSNTFIGMLPAELRAVLKNVTKYTNNTGGSSIIASDITATTDYVFLMSPCEVYGPTTNASDSCINYFEQLKQSRYAYYSAGNSSMRYGYNSKSVAKDCWLRSPSTANALGFTYADDDYGLVNSAIAVCNKGIAPCFCV